MRRRFSKANFAFPLWHQRINLEDDPGMGCLPVAGTKDFTRIVFLTCAWMRGTEGTVFFQMKFEQMTWKCVFERNQSSCISPFSWCLWFVGSVPCVFRSTILVSVLFMLLVQHDVPFAKFWSDHYFWKASLSLVSGYVPPNLDILSYLLEFWGLQ